MATIPRYKDWMKDTDAGPLTPRSTALKHLDTCLQAYESQPDRAMRDVVAAALENWKDEQKKAGKNWVSSVRNRKGAVTNLSRVFQPAGAAAPMTDRQREHERKALENEPAARAFLIKAQQEALQTLFAHRRLEWKANTLMGMKKAAGTGLQQFSTFASHAKDAGSAASTVKGVVKGVATANSYTSAASDWASMRVAGQSAMTKETLEAIRRKLVEFLRKLCPPGVNVNAVLYQLGLGNAIDFAAKVAPFFGMVSSGKDAASGLIGLAAAIHSRYAIGQARSAIRPGDPEKAFDAVLVMLNRELAASAATAGRASLAFIGQSLMVLFTGPGVVLTGPIVSAINLFAQIVHTIVEVARDHSERIQANRLLDRGVLGWELFAICPLLGCYYIAVQDHSTLINMAVAEFDNDHFVVDAERLTKKLLPVVEKAGALIRASRLELPGMQRYKGIVDADISRKGVLGKLTSAGGVMLDQISQSLESHSGKPDPRRGPYVDRSRIVGMGVDKNGKPLSGRGWIATKA